MPSNHSERDAEWIGGVLAMLSPAHQLKARVAYSEAYSEAYSGEATEHKKENKARQAANTRLRLFKDKCLQAYCAGLEQSRSNATSAANGSDNNEFRGF